MSYKKALLNGQHISAVVQVAAGALKASNGDPVLACSVFTGFPSDGRALIPVSEAIAEGGPVRYIDASYGNSLLLTPDGRPVFAIYVVDANGAASSLAGMLPVVSLTTASVTQNEGASGTSAFVFNVARGGDLSGTSSATWAVSASGANPASAADFVGAAFPTGTVTFGVGVAAQTITVNVLGDGTTEVDEGFTLTLSAPVNCTLGTATATGSIVNDDVALPGVFGAPTLTRTGTSGTAPQTYSIAGGSDTYEGIWVHLQQATDVGFTTGVVDYVFEWMGESWEAGDSNVGIVTISGSSWTRARFTSGRVLTDPSVVLGNWSNVVSETIVSSAAAWSTATGLNKSRYLNISNGNKSVRHNNNDGQYAKVRADRVAASTKWHDEIRLDDNWAASRIQIGVCDVGVAANANTDFDTGTGGTFTLPGDSGFKGFALNFGIGNNQIEWHANGTSGNFNVPAGMATLAANDWLITEADMTGASHVYTFYLWDASAGALANSGASIGSITLTSGNVPGATYRFGGGQKGNAGAGSDAFTWNPGSSAFLMTPSTGFNNPYA